MKTFLLLFCLGSNLAFGQRTLATYYDWQKTQKKEVYQVDANGERNGIYKNYDEDGALINEVMYKFGKMNGVWTVYTKFPNYKGVMQISSKETYVNDLKDGIAVYYRYDEDLGVYEIQRGNYKQDNKDGDWTVIGTLDKILTSDDFDYVKSLPVFKGSMALKSVITYDKGEKVVKASNNDKQETYYYPSNKIYYSTTIVDPTYTGEEFYYYPDGKIWSKKIVTNNKRVSFESYYYNGNIKIKEIANPYSYEGYSADGTPDRAMATFSKEQEGRKTQAEQLNQVVGQAKEEANNGNADEAKNHLQNQINKYENWKGSTYSFSSTETEELKVAHELMEKLDKQRNNQKKIESRSIAEVDSLTKSVEKQIGDFLAKFKVEKEASFVVIVDAEGKPIKKYKYPFGEDLFNKAGNLIYTESKGVSDNKQIDNTTKKQNLLRLSKLIQKLNALNEEDAKILNKKIKSAENVEDVKKILEY